MFIFPFWPQGLSKSAIDRLSEHERAMEQSSDRGSERSTERYRAIERSTMQINWVVGNFWAGGVLGE